MDTADICLYDLSLKGLTAFCRPQAAFECCTSPGFRGPGMVFYERSEKKSLEIRKGSPMRYVEQSDEYHVLCEDGESERGVVRALVIAIFEMCPSSTSAGISISADLADKFIDLDRDRHSGYPFAVADMDYIDGRMCKAGVLRHKDGSFTIRFAPSAGRQCKSTKDVIQRAEDIMSRITAYTGELLDSRLATYGFSRSDGESDWEFRQRVFPDLAIYEPERALEFLLGRRGIYWRESESVLATSVILRRKHYGSLRRFAEGFTDDPLAAFAIECPRV
jgi:hypothetical protein